MNPSTTLNKYGWRIFGDCNCSGAYWHKYSHPNFAGYEIWVAPELNIFRIYVNEEPKIEDIPTGYLYDTIQKNKLW